MTTDPNHISLDDVGRRPAVTCTADAPIDRVARLLAVNDVQAVVVTDADRHPVGIVTDRDIVRRAVAQDRDRGTVVADIMSRDVASIREDGDAAQAARQMADRECRSLPIVDADGRIVGMVAFDDVFEHIQDSLDALALVVRHRHHPSVWRAA